MLLSKILKENFWKLAVLDGRGNGKITSIWYVRSCEVLTTVIAAVGNHVGLVGNYRCVRGTYTA